MNNKIKYSVVLYIDKDIKRKDLAAINSLLESGIKIIIFTTEDISKKLESPLMNQYKKKRYLSIYYVDTDNINLETDNIEITDNDESYKVEKIVSIDGDNRSKIVELHKKNEEYCKIHNLKNEFNIGQYEAEHASESAKFIIVEAGAGAGKTTTMIDRVSFLTEKHNVDLESIHMITFTRESTKTMKEKIEKYFTEKFNTSKEKSKYRDKIEKQGNMVIRTIDAYFKDLVSTIGVELGCNQNTSIKSYKHIKQNLIKSFLDGEFYESDKDKENLYKLLTQVIKEIPLYDLEKNILNFWNKLQAQGIHDEEIVNLNWGGVDKTSSPRINSLINKLLEEAMKILPKKIEKIKKENNEIELVDFTIKLQEYLDIGNHDGEDKIDKIRNVMKNKNFNPRYILIDEFQDTNSDQIKIMVAINKILANQIFIVGDKKQGIYRFRGAKHTAFDEVRSLIGKDREDIQLKINYRTAGNVLDFMQKQEMSKWIVNGNNKFLDYELKAGSNNIGTYEKIIIEKPSDVIQSTKNIINSTNIMKQIENIITENIEIYDAKTIKAYKQAVLDKNNYDENIEELDQSVIKQIEYMLEREKVKLVTKQHVKEVLKKYKSNLTVLVRYNWEARKIKQWCDEDGVICDLDVEGNFYNCRAVRDFKYLVGAFLFDEEKYKISLKDTPYIGVSSIYSNYKNEFRNERFYVVINKIINESKVINNYYNEQLTILKEYKGMTAIERENEAKNRAKEYQMNLNKLINILKSNKSKDTGLKSVYDFLDVQIKTNRTENEEKINRDAVIKCITVHKSKGQEYKNLFIPFTNNIFIKEDRTEIIAQNKEVGYQIVQKNKIDTKKYYNNNYGKLINQEKNELREDEMRLLYVALTRVEENLIVIILENNQQNTWAELLSKRGIKQYGKYQ
ncbi:UvrD-helicase domain-containing protein [Romboutsia lituseburensis]|uniref:UvrD-helicase domain-containing protein n=1 Tax=Romboutsia lituseburensis TaxID=1537 RepID=UPI00215B12C5|nr:UvrD-helicase domain-containing protein [Romboutsia lituseburensis]MCR8743902.1 UvrD-helicase domain-containing protein [Romboutsia lituseburensis]